MSMAFSSYRNCSKSQMCFFKILHIISSIPPSKEEPFPSNNNKGVGIDLNLEFSSINESEESESSAETPNKNNNTNEGEVEVEVEVEEVVEEKSEDTQVQSFEVENKNNVETTSFQRNGNNCLDLLIEAARVISEKDESDSEGVKKRKERWVVVDLYDDDVAGEREPVVRSKRGRNQALPHRFRDSVVEPLKRSGRLQRSSSTSTSKRHLR